MAKSETSKTETATVTESVYVTEQSPDLPSADISAERPDPVIDKRLVEIRNAEAQKMADRVNGK